MSKSIFGEWWMQYGSKSPKERFKHFDSLSSHQQSSLKKSFFEESWDQLFYCNEIDKVLDSIKLTHNIDIIDLRIKAIWFGRVFLIEKHIWNNIVRRINYFGGYYDISSFWGGLSIRPWGNENMFYRITGA